MPQKPTQRYSSLSLYSSVLLLESILPFVTWMLRSSAVLAICLSDLQQVREATKRLETEAVLKFAHHLDHAYLKRSPAEQPPIRMELPIIITETHRRGNYSLVLR